MLGQQRAAGGRLLACLLPGSWRCRALGGCRVLAPRALVAAVGRRLPGRDQVVLATADQLVPAHALQGLAQQRPVVGVVVAQKGLVQTAAALALDGVDLLTALVAVHAHQRVQAGVVHGRGGGHGAGVEALHLVGAKAIFLQPQRQVEHVLIRRAGVRGDEVRDQELLLAGLGAVLLEHRLEAVVAADAGLHHLRERPGLGVLGRDLQVAAHVVLHQFLHVGGRLHGQVVAQAGADQHLLHARQLAHALVDGDQRIMVGGQVLADAGVDAAGLAAGRFDLGRLAAQPVHVGRGAAQVADDAGEALHLVAHGLDFAHDGVFGAALDDAALVLGDGAEGAAAEAAAHDVDAEADHLPRGDLGFAIVAAARVGVAGVRIARVGQVEDVIHLGRGQRDGRRVEPHVPGRGAFAVRLHQRAGVAGVGLQVQHAVGVGVEHGVALDLLVAGQADDRPLA